MPFNPELPDDGEALQFSTAEPARPADIPSAAGAAPSFAGAPEVASALGPVCFNCRQPVVGQYYAIRNKLICPQCRALITGGAPGNKLVRVLKATVFGFAGGLLGAAIWFAVRKITNMEIGLIAVLVGYLVGTGVRKASAGYGGRGYQLLAVVITYACIAINYVPDVVQGVMAAEHRHSARITAQHSPATSQTAVGSSAAAGSGMGQSGTGKPRPSLGKALGLMALLVIGIFALAAAAPFLGGIQNALGLVIIGIALWEAWRRNRSIASHVTGPYQLGAGPLPDGGEIV